MNNKNKRQKEEEENKKASTKNVASPQSIINKSKKSKEEPDDTSTVTTIPKKTDEYIIGFDASTIKELKDIINERCKEVQKQKQQRKKKKYGHRGAPTQYSEKEIQAMWKYQTDKGISDRETIALARVIADGRVRTPSLSWYSKRKGDLKIQVPLPKDLEGDTVNLLNFAFDPSKSKDEQSISRSVKGILRGKPKKIIENGKVIQSKGVSSLIDSSGLDITDQHNYRSEKYQNTKRKEFMKLHILSDLKTKQIIDYEITDGHTHDTTQFIPLLERATDRIDNIVMVYADAAYGSRINFECCEKNKIFPGIKTKENYVPKQSDCYTRRKTVTIQNDNYESWRDTIKYGNRSIVESIFSTIKRKFGEKIRSRIPERMRNELRLKITLYNQYVTGMYYKGIT